MNLYVWRDVSKTRYELYSVVVIAASKDEAIKTALLLKEDSDDDRFVNGGSAPGPSMNLGSDEFFQQLVTVEPLVFPVDKPNACVFRYTE
jgi:hypothetical protein